MINTIKITICACSIWVLAAVINAILCAGSLFFSLKDYEDWSYNFYVAFVFTLFFSAPAILFFWFIFLLNTKENSKLLFRLLFRYVFFSAVFFALVFAIGLYPTLGSGALLLAYCIVTAAVFSLMCHHYFIIAIYKSKLPKHA